MKNSLPSISLGAISTLLVPAFGTRLIETIIIAFLGGVIGYLAKLFAEWMVNKFKKLFRK